MIAYKWLGSLKYLTIEWGEKIKEVRVYHHNPFLNGFWLGLHRCTIYILMPGIKSCLYLEVELLKLDKWIQINAKATDNRLLLMSNTDAFCLSLHRKREREVWEKVGHQHTAPPQGPFFICLSIFGPWMQQRNQSKMTIPIIPKMNWEWRNRSN